MCAPLWTGWPAKDGTYFDAQAAVKAGIIPSENIIRTSKQLCRKVHDEIAGLADTAAIQELMDRVSEGNKPFEDIFPTLTETENDMANEKQDTKVLSTGRLPPRWA